MRVYMRKGSYCPGILTFTQAAAPCNWPKTALLCIRIRTTRSPSTAPQYPPGAVACPQLHAKVQAMEMQITAGTVDKLIEMLRSRPQLHSALQQLVNYRIQKNVYFTIRKSEVKVKQQVGQLWQTNRAAAWVSLSKNIGTRVETSYFQQHVNATFFVHYLFENLFTNFVTLYLFSWYKFFDQNLIFIA